MERDTLKEDKGSPEIKNIGSIPVGPPPAYDEERSITVWPPPAYDEKVRLDVWMTQLRLYMNARGLKEDKDKVTTLLQNIGLTMLEKIIDWSYPSDPETKSFDELVKLIKDNIALEPSLFLRRVRFFNECQKQGQSIQEYFAHMRQLYSQCLLEDMKPEDFVILAILRGIKNDALRQFLMDPGIKWKNLIEMQNLAISFEQNSVAARDVKDNDVKPDLYEVNFDSRSRKCGAIEKIPIVKTGPLKYYKSGYFYPHWKTYTFTLSAASCLAWYKHPNFDDMRGMVSLSNVVPFISVGPLCRNLPVEVPNLPPGYSINHLLAIAQDPDSDDFHFILFESNSHLKSWFFEIAKTLPLLEPEIIEANRAYMYKAINYLEINYSWDDTKNDKQPSNQSLILSSDIISEPFIQLGIGIHFFVPRPKRRRSIFENPYQTLSNSNNSFAPAAFGGDCNGSNEYC